MIAILCHLCGTPTDLIHRGGRLVYRGHGSVDVDRCETSGKKPPAPTTPQPGWRVAIATRDDGPVCGPLRIGVYDETGADRDERMMRLGPDSSSEWLDERAGATSRPVMAGSSARWIEYFTPEEVAEQQDLARRGLALAREIEREIGVARGRS